MSKSRLAIIEDLVRLVKAGDHAAGAFLGRDVVYRTLGLELIGRAQVLSHLIGSDKIYRQAEWSEARIHGDAVLVEGKVSEESPHNSKILLFYILGDEVVTIEEQLLLPMKAPAETPLKLSSELQDMINTALMRRNPLLVAHVDEGGQPAMSFRGSIHVFTDDQLAMWVRNAKGRFLRAITANPQVALMYRDNDARATFQFHGRARIAQGQAERQRVFESMPQAERDHDFARLGTAVIIELDRVEGYAGVAAGGVVGAVNMRRFDQIFPSRGLVTQSR